MGARLVPWSGVGAVVLTFAGFAVAGNAPNGTASVARVVSYYSGHSGSQTASGVLLSLGALLFLVFAATRDARNPLSLVGAGLAAAGLAIYAGLSISMADVATRIDGSALQSLNVLANDAVFIFLITIGASVFLLGVAAAPQPRWLRSFALVFAVVGAIPSHVLGGTLDHIGVLAFAGVGIWILVTTFIAARATDLAVPLPDQA